jgi:hypothetical protein
MRALSKSWIDTKLSLKERAALVEYLFERSHNPTGKQIHEALGELFPNKDLPSVKACIEWKTNQWPLEIHLRTLSQDSAWAKAMVEGSEDIADANKRLTDSYVFQNLCLLRLAFEGDENAAKKIDPNILEWILASSRLAKRTENEKRLEAQLSKANVQTNILREKLEQFLEDKKASEKLVKKMKQKGFTEEDLKELEQKLKLMK